MHNIIRDDGSETIPGKEVLAETLDVKSMIAWAKGEFTRVIDLGAGEGGYAIAFKRAGFEVVCVEAREENCNKIRAIDPTMHIIEQTVEYYLAGKDSFPKGTLILCLGLLYHLPDPALILNIIASKADAIILSTHYALENHWAYDNVSPWWSRMYKRICKRFPTWFEYTHYGLSKLVTYKGRKGRWYPEYPKGYQNVIELTHSSYHNYRSFWLLKQEIFDICKDNGIPSVWGRVRRFPQGLLIYFRRTI